MAETPAAANVSDSADRISHATYTSVSSAISRAKQAAADVGINTMIFTHMNFLKSISRVEPLLLSNLPG